MGPEALAQVLRPLAELFPAGSRPELLVGLEAGDDAAVYRLDDSRALVFTADFFTPVVDDPREFGAVAAANSLSDVYAMGGEPALALNIASFPSSLPAAVIEDIFRGGAEKAREAGCAVVGGHTITSKEPAYGMAVIGFVDPGKMFLKTGVRAGDTILLTKPIGVGVITTALKNGKASATAIAAALDSMKRLNRDAARIFAAHGVRGCTDVTGFSLLGHGLELASKSSVGLRLRSAAVPLVEGAAEAARAGMFPGGTGRNTDAFEKSVRFAAGVTESLRALFFSPETSGGLLAAVPPDRAETCLAALRAAGMDAAAIGRADSSIAPGTITVD
jgi:selenide, water dikinase